MRNLIRQIVSGYKSLNLEGQNEGYVVFSGEEPDTKQAVSIKILPRLLGQDPEIAQSFQRLAQTIRLLNHPNIAPIHKVGEEAGLPYLVTKSLEKAQSLAAKLNQPWAIDAAADVVMQVGEALDHAYRKGIVHGGLTPENVEVEDDGQVVVTGFGLSELQNLVGVQLKEVVSPFLAPEKSKGGKADGRADIYSLAAILYAMLANRPPQIVKGQVLPPSRFNGDVPPAMDAVVVKALALNPEERYPDARSFLTALGAVSLAPLLEKTYELTAEGQCTNCGARDQNSRYCRKCGVRLKPAQKEGPIPTSDDVLAQPIQITKIEVGRVQIGKGVELHDTEIAAPMSVATGELLDLFPEPLEVPRIDTHEMWSTVLEESQVVIPEPPPMPTIDWAEIAPPMPEVPTFDEILVDREDD
jgi:serine/threonine protein kinase